MAEREDLVASYVDRVEAAWVHGGVLPRVRRRLALDLERDLTAALESGASAAEVFSVEPTVLAADIAAAEGHPSTDVAIPRGDSRGLALRDVGASVAMAGFIWFFAVQALASTFYRAALG